MCKGVRRLSWGDIYCDLMSTADSDYSSWLECGGICVVLDGHWNVKYFVLTPRYFLNESAMWPFAGQDIPHTGWPSHQRCPGRNWSALPSPVLGHFRFLQATLKSLAAVGRVWLGYITATWSNKNRRKRDDDFFPNLSLYKRIFRYTMFLCSHNPTNYKLSIQSLFQKF